MAIALVVGVIVVLSSQTGLSVTTSTERFTTTTVITTTTVLTLTSVVNNTTTISIYGNVELAGNCTAVGVFIPDTSSYGANETHTYSNTTYSTWTYVSATASYVIRIAFAAICRDGLHLPSVIYPVYRYEVLTW